nr:Gag-Pol polyprotein [Tanacetum cinerariifolium]
MQFLKEAAKFVGNFKSLAKEADESLSKHKALELEIERLLRAVGICWVRVMYEDSIAFWSSVAYESSAARWLRIEPKNVKEAMTDHVWIKLMQEELLQFKRLDVWVLVPAPDNISPLTLKWLFKNKHDEEQTVIRNKSSFLYVFGALCYPKNDREDIGKLGAKGDIGFFIGYSADSCAYRIYNRRTKKIMETMNVSFDELLAMAFEQRSSKPGLQSMTSGQISSGLDLNYAPSTITT